MKKTRILSKWFQKQQKHFSKIGGLEFYRVLELEMSTIWKQCRGNDHWADESQCGAHFYNSLLNSSLSLCSKLNCSRFCSFKTNPKNQTVFASQVRAVCGGRNSLLGPRPGFLKVKWPRSSTVHSLELGRAYRVAR